GEFSGWLQPSGGGGASADGIPLGEAENRRLFFFARCAWMGGVTRNEIADVLNNIAVLLELKGENPFKTRAYQAGARTLAALEEDLGTVIAEGRLGSLKGIGEALAKKITGLHETGRLDFYEELRASIAPGLIEMLEVPGLGAKKIRALHERLGIDTLSALDRACRHGLVAGLAGFGGKTQANILAGIRHREACRRRHLWWDAACVAEPILAGLRGLPQVRRAERAGSLRRGLETVGNLDFIAAVRAGEDAAPVADWFAAQPGAREVTVRDATRTGVRFEGGLQADLRIVPWGQFAFALHHFTGSRDHNAQMRRRALARGLRLDERGLEPAQNGGAVEATAVAGAAGRARIASEEALFEALGLAFIPPELREGLGEIEAAEAGTLPRLIEVADLRGAFHNHTVESDGDNTLEEMAAAAQALGWEYLGIADHSKSSFQAHGLDEARLLAQAGRIEKLNASGRFAVHVFAGTECDILRDGRLDFDDATLARLDYVVASVHNAFLPDEDAMTARIIRAIENPRVTMLGHMTGRQLLRREGYRVNVAKIIDAAIANGVVIELNANPWRLDMDWRHWRRAAERGLRCSINPDAHETAGLAYVEAGVNAARKGWLEKEHVVNTLPLAKMKAWLRG
ncbi:MAG: DNA polymerase/3'-5' exonuclease PolX, partial [Opitutaceae bacterium]|nr:DNA polymerase/3'-5' exonuclease PolX [Opitutaceae bacterium]